EGGPAGGEQVEADHRDRPAEDRLVALDQIDAGADDDDRADDRGRAAVEGKAQQRGVLAQETPAFLRQLPPALDPAHSCSPSSDFSTIGVCVIPLPSKYSHSCSPSSVEGWSA